MAYQIILHRPALKALQQLPRQEQKKISKAINRLANDPRPAGVKKLQGKREFYRLRIGHYRVIYTVEDDRLVVLVLRIGHRQDVYKGL